MIDLAKLERAAFSAAGDRTVVSRNWLKQVHAELTACREGKQPVFDRRARSL